MAKGSATMTQQQRPSDIHPDSGFRLPLPERDDLGEAAKEIYDGLCDPKGRSLVGLRGPGGIRLHSPRLAEVSSPVNRYLRWEAGFSGRVRELAILVTAREHDSQFEWVAHEDEAVREGLPREIVDIVKHQRPVAGLPETDAVIIQFGRELFGRRRVSSETFARALAIFGSRGLVDLVSLMGQYAATAALLCAFDIQLHPGREAPWPTG
jgi:4-carboxymuconolactone decarboxylase